MELIPVQALREALSKAFQEAGAPEDVATVTTEALVQASLFGIDSHGVRLFGHYVDEIKNQRIVPSNRMDFIEHESTVSCNAQWSLSHYAARLTLERMGRLAGRFGISIGTISRSDHIGALGVHAVNAGLGHLVVLAFSNANALALTPAGDRVLFGTNPFSLVTGSGDSLVYIDSSSTQFTMNRVKMYGELELELPEGVARDTNFESTTDPNLAKYLEPLGGHKGFALAYLVEVMTSGITNSPHSFEIPDMYSVSTGEIRQLSHTFIAIDSSFFGLDPVVQSPGQQTERIVGSGNPTELPGRRERQIERERLATGIPVSPYTLNQWESLGVRFD